MTWVANLSYAMAAFCYLPVLGYQMAFQNKNRQGWAERFGNIPARSSGQDCIWIHAVSLGEVNATTVLVKQLREACPQFEILITTTTDTGYRRATQLYPDLTVHRSPIDFSWVIHRVLRRIRPRMIILMELEVWYNMVTIAHRQGIPVCVANGRLTNRSYNRLLRLRPLIRPMFQRLTFVCAQTNRIAARFKQLGVAGRRIEVAGSMKWDTAVVSDEIGGASQLRDALGLQGPTPIIVLGSSGPGEEELLIDTWEQMDEADQARLVLVPRRPERFDEVARLIQRRGYTCVRRSQHADDCTPAPVVDARTIVLGDTMGELRKLYNLAAIVIVGRSMVPLGGSDPMEVAALGKPIIVGPYTDNFSAPIRVLLKREAVVVAADGAARLRILTTLMRDENSRREMGERARAVVLENQGATAHTVARLQGLMSLDRAGSASVT